MTKRNPSDSCFRGVWWSLGNVMRSKQPVPPLARNVTKDVLDWDDVDPPSHDTGRDMLGLSPQDRKALGLSAPRTADLQAPTLGGSEQALAEVLTRGGAIGKTDFRRKD